MMDFMNEDLMKNLQQTAERLSKLNLNQPNPWQSLGQMQQIFNHDFWNDLSQLSKYSTVKEEVPQTKAKDTVKNIEQEKNGPCVDIFETLGKVIVCCDVPGLDKNSLKISLSNGDQLVIQGKIKEHNLSEYRISKERFEGKFTRKISLPSGVLSDPVKTSYRDGRLELSFTKNEHKQTKSDIQIDL